MEGDSSEFGLAVQPRPGVLTPAPQQRGRSATSVGEADVTHRMLSNRRQRLTGRRCGYTGSMGRGEMRASGRLLFALGALCVPCIAGHLACDHSSSSPAPGPSCSIQPAIACPPPNAPATLIAAAHNYAVRKLYLGDTDRTGIINSDAWKAFGYDLDGLVATAQSTNVCTLVAGAPIATQQDGKGPRTNNATDQPWLRGRMT